MPVEAWITLLVISTVLITMFVSNRSPDLIMWCGVIVLTLVPVRLVDQWKVGILSPKDALSGLANEGVVTIAAMFVIVAGLRETGALQYITRFLVSEPRNLFSAQNRIVWPTALTSAFMNNTPLVAMLLPVIDEWAKRHKQSVSRLLMPLSFASILGGACTLIGTSTNLVVNGWVIENMNHPGLGMFEITKLGAPVAVIGILYLLSAQRWLLKDRKPTISHADDARQYTVEMIVESDSRLVGKTIQEAGLRGLPGLYLIEIDRAGDILPAVSSNVVLQSEDRLVFAGIVDSVIDLQKFNGLRPASDQVHKMNDPRHKRILIEAVVSNTCPMIGKSIREGRFRTLYNAAVIAVARNGEHLNKKIGDIVLKIGDTLLLEARPGFVEQQRNSRDFYLVSQVENTRPVNREKAGFALLLLFLLISTAATGVLSIIQAALFAAAVMVASNCCSTSVARRSIDMQTLLIIAAAIGLGNAMNSSGLADGLGNILLNLPGADPAVMLAVVFIITMMLGNLITAKAGAVLMLPIAVSISTSLGVSYVPFIIAVMFASATSLATPISYPTNSMIFGAGGYRSSDYLMYGLPLSLIIAIISIFLIPLFWKF